MTYFLSQICVFLSYVFLGLTYLIKKRELILFFSVIALIFNGFSYSLLGAWAGLAVVFIALLRNVLFLVQQKIKILDKYKIDDYIILAVLLTISVVMAIFTYDSFFSLFTVASSMVYTVSVWQRNIKAYKILGVISSALSIVYFIFIKSLFGVILESILCILTLISTIIYILKEKEKVGVENKR